MAPTWTHAANGRCLGAHATRSELNSVGRDLKKKNETFIARYTTRTSFSWDLGNWYWNLEVNSAGGRLNQNAHQGEARTSAFCENIQTAHITAAGATDEEGDLKKVHGASPTPTGHIPGGTPLETAVLVLDTNKATPPLRHSAPKPGACI